MKKYISIIALMLAAVLVLSFCGCSGDSGDDIPELSRTVSSGQNENGSPEYIFGSEPAEGYTYDDIFGYAEKVDTAALFDSLEYTPDMFRGVYVLKDEENDIEDFKKNIPFRDLEFTSGTFNTACLPMAVCFGNKVVSSEYTSFLYSDLKQLTDKPVALLRFALKDGADFCPFTFEIKDGKLVFTEVVQTSEPGEPFTYEPGKLVLEYGFKLRGTNLELSDGKNTVNFVSYAFSEMRETAAVLSGCLVPGSAGFYGLDSFDLGQDGFNTASNGFGSYFTFANIKISGDGDAIIFLVEDGQYITENMAYIYIDEGSFNSSGGMLFFDGKRIYDYTDDIFEREERLLDIIGGKPESETDIQLSYMLRKNILREIEDTDSFPAEAAADPVYLNISVGAGSLFGEGGSSLTDGGKKILDGIIAAFSSVFEDESYSGKVKKIIIHGIGDVSADEVSAYFKANGASLPASEAVSADINTMPLYTADGELDTENSARVTFTFVLAQ